MNNQEIEDVNVNKRIDELTKELYEYKRNEKNFNDSQDYVYKKMDELDKKETDLIAKENEINNKEKKLNKQKEEIDGRIKNLKRLSFFYNIKQRCSFILYDIQKPLKIALSILGILWLTVLFATFINYISLDDYGKLNNTQKKLYDDYHYSLNKKDTMQILNDSKANKLTLYIKKHIDIINMDDEKYKVTLFYKNNKLQILKYPLNTSAQNTINQENLYKKLSKVQKDLYDELIDCKKIGTDIILPELQLNNDTLKYYYIIYSPGFRDYNDNDKQDLNEPTIYFADSDNKKYIKIVKFKSDILQNIFNMEIK